MLPIALTGFNRDIVVENNASGPPFNSAALEFNSGEDRAFYQAGLPGFSQGLPVSGAFTSATGDGTIFQFQPYTSNNVLDLSAETGFTTGTLTLVSPALFNRVAVIANAADGDGTGSATIVFHFTDGSSYTNTYYAPDWFNNTANVALAGVDRIVLSTGVTEGGTTDPRFYETTFDLQSLLGAANKPLASLTFSRATGSVGGQAGATGIYALSGETLAQSPPQFTSEPSSLTVGQFGTANFAAAVNGNPYPELQWFKNGAALSGETNLALSYGPVYPADDGATFFIVASSVVSNVNYSVTSSVATLTVKTIMTPIAATGYNEDVIIENTATGPPYNNYAVEMNAGEGTAFYETGLPGTQYGLPPSGSFFSAEDGTQFQFQSYTANNALVLNADTAESSGFLTLTTPAVYQSIAILANSGSADSIGLATVILHFTDGTSYQTTYNAPDWFNNAPFALAGVDRINLSSGGTDGGPSNPRFYQSTLNLVSLLGASNKPLASLELSKADSANSTAIYALSGILLPPAPPSFVAGPSNVTTLEMTPATFSVAVAGNPYPALQWFTNGVAARGATNAAFTIAPAPLADNNLHAWIVASNVVSNVNYSITSAVAILIVTPDTNPPVLVGAQSFGLSQVNVLFSKPVSPASGTTIANYTLTGPSGPVTISGAVLNATDTQATLTVAPMTEGGAYILTVNNIVDQTSHANVIAPNSQASFVASPYAPASVGYPAAPGSQTASTNGLTLASSGGAIGGAADQFQLSYKSVTGDFNLAVRLTSLSLSDTWSKAGLMAREALTNNARFTATLATPVMNGCFFEWRDPAGSANQQTGSFPDNFPNTWLRLQRAGNLFSSYASYDGQTWTLLGSQTIAMASQVYLGFVVDSDQTNQTALAQFTQITNVPINAVVGAQPAPTEPLAACSRTTPIVISEIMWKPAARADTNDCEFIELYNSNPWFWDISSYQLVCADLSYKFPPGTIMPGGGFLVVAASPGSIRNVYGITNVIGPYTGSLKHSETLQLLDEQGSILLTVPYTDVFPWPAASDGTGHSIVLANPSYGAGDPRAWAISDSIGGSPGQMEPYHPSPLRGVVLDEVLAHSESGSPAPFVKLYNHSAAAVDISGCALSDDPGSNQFVIPSGTILGPGAFKSFNASAGFQLNPSGDTIYFVNPTRTRVLDALQFTGQSDGVSFGRWPDGANDYYPLQAVTPGTNNSAILIGNIVINELMFDPISGNDDDQYIELYNQGSNSVSLAGWQFTAGVTYTFPPGATIAPNGYVVVARNTAELFSRYPNLSAANTYGDYSGKLSHDGERVALSMPQPLYGTNTVYVVEDEVTYGKGGRWGEWSSGGGSSLELIDPRSNHRLAANWADSDESQKSTWVQVQTTGVLDNGANYESGIEHAQLGILDVGECMVDNVQVNWQGTNYCSNPTFESGLTGWSPQGSHIRSSIDSPGYNSSYALHVRSSDKFWTAENSCQVSLTANRITAGDTVTLSYMARWLHGNPEPDFRLNGNWLEATTVLPIPSNLGTPGAPNSRLVSNAGPAIYQVTHSPPVPAANQSVVVTARVHDPDGVQSLTLYYRIDPSSAYSSVAMHDNGTGGDAIAGDGIYSATIPAQSANTIVAFYVSASDKRGAGSRFPALLADNSPVRECVVMFGDGNPGGSFGVYHMWLTQTNVNRWANLADLSNEGNDFTFVYNNNRVIYNVQGHYSGSPFHQQFDTPIGNLCAYKWEFPDDDQFLGATDFNKIHQPGNSPGDDPSLQREQTTWSFMRALGVPWGYRRFVAVYANGNRRGVLMEDAQVPDSDMVKQYFPNDTDGYLYKMQPWFEAAPFPSGYGIGVSAEAYCYLKSYTTTGGAKKAAAYRYNYEVRRTPDSYSNFTNVYSLVDAASSSTSPNYVANMESVANMNEWMRVFAANHAAGNIDSFGTEISQNMYGYAGVNGTKYTLMPWDLNIDLGGPQSLAPGAELLGYDPNDPNMGIIYQTPEFLRMYWRAQSDLVNSVLNINLTTGPLLNAKYKAFVNNGLSVENPNDALLPWISQAGTSIAAQMAAVDTTNFAVNPKPVISNNVAYFSGSAPIAVAGLWLNGVYWPVTWTALTAWQIAVPLKPGNNNFTVTGVNAMGQPISGDTATASTTYSGPNPSPVGNVVFSEIMYAPPVPNAAFVELYNNSTNFTFDLSGWSIPALNFTFTNGAAIGPRSYLVLAADRAAFAAAYGATRLISGAFSGTLQPPQLLTLLQPGANGTNLVVDELFYDRSAPWPTNVTDNGYSLQVVDPRQDNWRLGNWAAGPATPGAASSVAASLTPFEPLWLNEIQPQNLTGITNSAGQRAPWIELYNPTSNSVSLSGLYLSDNYTNFGQWALPATAVVRSNQFLVIFADGRTDLSTSNELHASFTLAPGSGSLALSRFGPISSQALDYIDYTNILANDSYGDYPDGQSFVRQAFPHPTPGAPNNGSAKPPSSFVAYVTPGAVYSQNFDSLPDPGASSVNSGNPVTIDGVTYSLPNPFDFAAPVSPSGENGGLGLAAMAGWYGLSDPAASVGVRFGAQDGDQTTGGQISFGLPSDNNRALGLLATSTTGYTAFGLRLLNGTGETLNYINVQATGEVWRQSNLGKTLTFSYYVDQSATNTFSTTASAYLPALNVSLPAVAADSGGAPVDGTAPANQEKISVANQPIVAWGPGEALWLVWEMTSPAGKSQGLAIDNFTFSATPDIASESVALSAQLSGTNIILNWPAASGQTYEIQYKTNLSDSAWQPLSSVSTGAGATLSFTNNFSGSQRFYRLAILPP